MIKNKTFYVDIDNTICSETGGKYEEAKPFKDRISKINDLFFNENTIIYYTARGMNRFNGNKF